jgi:hypothetical protein
MSEPKGNGRNSNVGLPEPASQPDASTGTGSFDQKRRRFAQGSVGQARTGKRGGLRVIYYWKPAEGAIYMLYAYAKNEQEDLTPAQTRLLGQLAREEFK